MSYDHDFSEQFLEQLRAFSASRIEQSVIAFTS